MDLLPAKERISMANELEKLEANLGGVADMRRQPDAVFIIDLKKEALAVREARRLGLPVIALVDTNADPDEADYVIPGNDDAIRSCGLIARVIADAIDAGKQKVTTRDFERQASGNGNGAAPTSTAQGDTEVVEREVIDPESIEPESIEPDLIEPDLIEQGAAVELDTEGESVPVPTGRDPQNEGAAETKDAVASTEENPNG